MVTPLFAPSLCFLCELCVFVLKAPTVGAINCCFKDISIYKELTKDWKR